MNARLWPRGVYALLILLVLLACKRGEKNQGPSGSPSAASGKEEAGVLTVSQEQQASWVRNFNPLLSDNSARWPTRAGIYEPLLIYNTLKGDYVPWLATSHAWSEGNKKLTFKIRPEVKWSDGKPFSASDVVFTFELMKKHKALDLQGVFKFVDSVSAPDAGTVEFAFKEPYVPALFYIGHQPIVPEHQWKDIADPVTYANENPVGTGPFTEVVTFQNQVYELGPNPHYWQKGKPAIKKLRFPALPSNDQANLAVINGEVDWAANFIPDVEKTFVAKDPKHHGYWFPLIGGTIMVYLNTTLKPFDDVRVRKAISMAIDRDQIVKVAMYNYTRPADGTGLSDAFKDWRNPEAAKADWVKLNVEGANALLDQAGLKKGAGGVRQVGGKPFEFEIIVPTGWSDWVRAAQIVGSSLKKVGINANLKTYDFSAWFEKVQKGDFTGAMGWTNQGPDPYFVYRAWMSSETKLPIGQMAASNWHRFSTPEADALFAEFVKTSDRAEQKRIMNQLQLEYVRTAPAIPLCPNPSWGEFNTKRIVGFPSKDNPYAKLSTYPAPEYLLVLTELKPRHMAN